MHLIRRFYQAKRLVAGAFLCALVWTCYAESAPALLLAKKYQGDIDLSDYWISEKYDGVRAYWNGHALMSRQGNAFKPPDWFTQGFPGRPLDGELWIDRGQFEAVMSVVSKDQPIDAEWRQVKYMLFELPEAAGSFSQRIEQMQRIVAEVGQAHLRVVPQRRIENDPQRLQALLEEITAAGGEGLMLHRASAVYHSGRSDDLLKVKTYEDAEAKVVGHLPGKGKYDGMLGALLVETEGGNLFRIGSGFSDAERANPPAVGSWVTYKYFGKTKYGIPRFASYLRVYQTEGQ